MTSNLEQRAEELIGTIESCWDDSADKPHHPCKCKKQVVAALRQTREEALEEAAKVAESGFPMNTQQISVIVERIHALKSNSDVNEVNTSGSEEGK